jgi:hypothetical protein
MTMKTEFRFTPRTSRLALAVLLLSTLSPQLSTAFAQGTAFTFQGRVQVSGTNFTGTGQFKFALVDAGSNVVRQATAAVTVSLGFVVTVALIDGGAGYLTPPAVTVSDVTGSNAVLAAQVSGGAVTGISVMGNGQNYSAGALVVIAPPPPNVVHQTYWSNDGTSTAGSEPANAVPVPVQSGLFTVLLGDTNLANMHAIPLDAFDHPDIRLRLWFNDGASGFAQLVPDQPFASAPYAIRALAADMASTAQLAYGLPAGAVSTAMLASNAVTAGQIAAGAVGTAQLADGAVTTSKFEPTHYQGTVLASHLAFGGLNGSGLPLAVAFGEPLNDATPVLTFDPPSTQLTAASSNGFSARVQFRHHTLSLNSMPQQWSSLASVNGRPAISFSDGSLKFARAGNARGIGPWTVVTVAATGPFETSLAVVNCRPAIGYSDFSGNLKFAYASDGDGGGPWTIVVVDNDADDDESIYPSMKVVNGRPAISYHHKGQSSLFYAYAADAQGNGPWTVTEVDSAGQGPGPLGAYNSLAMVNGVPAISYYSGDGQIDGKLTFAYATDAQGTGSWIKVMVDGAGDVGEFTSLAVVNGRPAISYGDISNGDLKFAYASDAQGAGPWTVLTVDSAGTVGRYNALAVISGVPVISYYDTSNGDLKLAAATDPQGAGPWNTLTVDSAGLVGPSTSLARIEGTAAISYYDDSNHRLKYATIPDVHWTAGTGEVAPLLAAGAASVQPDVVGAAQLRDAAVTTAKLAEGAVTSDRIADGTIQSKDMDAATFSTTFWKTDGNAGTAAGTHFLGTTDNRPLELRAGGRPVLRLEGQATGYRLIAGTSNAVHTTSTNSAVLGGRENGIGANAHESTIVGGRNNIIGADQRSAFLGGGFANEILADNQHAVIAGGRNHRIGTNCVISAVLGGAEHRIGNNVDGGLIVGGFRNEIQGSHDPDYRQVAPVILGGSDNVIEGGTARSGIGVFAHGSSWAAILGGDGHRIGTNCPYAVIAGGQNNLIADNADFSFVAGQRARGDHVGAWVWADNQAANFHSAGVNTFNIRAQGGLRLNGDTSQFFGSSTRQMLNLWSTRYGIGVQSSTTYFRTGTRFSWFRGGDHAESENDPGGGTVQMTLTSSGLTVNGVFVSTSDRNVKAGFAPVNAKEILEKVVALPIRRWHFTNDTATPHLGPVAQDFHAAFEVGPDDKHIATVDADGVALAAIQGLNQKVEAREATWRAELKQKEVEIAELRERLARLENLLSQSKSQ